MWLRFLSACAAALIAASAARAGDGADPFRLTAPGAPSPTVEPLNYLAYAWSISERPLKQSWFVFGGRTSSTDIWSTAIFNLGRKDQSYDNFIVGGAYQHDLLRLNGGVVFGAEVGLADRFGNYKVCCASVVYSDTIVNSAEVWGGVTGRYEGISLFGVNVTPGVTFGLSAISNPIGQEAYHAVPGKGSAALLFYLGIEGAFAFADNPDTELVVRLHHRSGAYGTLGGLKEGNNANVVGIRHRF